MRKPIAGFGGAGGYITMKNNMVNKEKLQEAVRHMVKQTERELQCEARLSELQSLRKEVEGMKRGKVEGEEPLWEAHYQGFDECIAHILSLLDERIKHLKKMQ